MFFKVFQLFLLGTLEGSHALEHLVPVNKGSVELRTVDADKLRFASDGQAAGTTHTRSIYHDGIQRYFARDVVLLGGKIGEFHHDRRTDGEDLIDMFFLFDELLNTDSNNTLLTV